MRYKEIDINIKAIPDKEDEALLNQHNFSSEIKNDIKFGGVKRLEYQFNTKENKLIKTIYNAN